MILDRPWSAGWDYSPELLAAVGDRLDALNRAAGRGGAATTAVPEIGRLLAADPNVGAAVDVAIAERRGGQGSDRGARPQLRGGAVPVRGGMPRFSLSRRPPPVTVARERSFRPRNR